MKYVLGILTKMVFWISSLLVTSIKMHRFTKYSGGYDKAIVVDGKSGKMFREIPISDFLGAGTIYQGVLFCGSQKGLVYAFDLSAGTVKSYEK
jgi:hypothetical protein